MISTCVQKVIESIKTLQQNGLQTNIPMFLHKIREAVSAEAIKVAEVQFL